MQIATLAAITPGQGRIGSIDGALDRARYALSLPFRSLHDLLNKYRGHKAIICGGGPSIVDTLPDIRRHLRLSHRRHVMALNKTHDWLLNKGIDPKQMLAIMIDPKPWVAGYMTPTRGVKYLLGSKLHKDVYDRFRGFEDQVYLWQTWEHRDEEISILPREFPHKKIIHISGFSTVGLRALNVCYDIGFRQMELHGYDSSYGGNHRTHAYAKNVPSDDNADTTLLIDPQDGTQRGYDTNVHMGRQFKEFFECMDQYDELVAKGIREPVDIRVAGHGALQYGVATKYAAGRTSARHVIDAWNDNPSLMPGGMRGLKTIAQYNADNAPQLGGIRFDPGPSVEMNMPVVSLGDIGAPSDVFQFQPSQFE